VFKIERKRELIIGPDDCKESIYSINGFLDELSIIGEVRNRYGAPVDSHNFDGYIAITPTVPLEEAKEHVNRVFKQYSVPDSLKVEYFSEN